MATGRGGVALSSCGCCGSEQSSPIGAMHGLGLLRCRRCRTIRFAAILPPDRVYQQGYHFGEGDFGWDYASKEPYEEVIAAARVEWLERFHRPGTLLDVGGGLGYLTAAAEQRGWKAQLLEPVPQAVAHAEARFGVRGTVGGVEKLGELGSSFDAVSLVHCLEHLPAAHRVLEDVRGRLAPGGMLFVEVPNHGSLARRLQGSLWLGWQAGEHAYIFQRRSLLALLRRAGFQPLAVRTWVPRWNGLTPDGYAHFLGLQRVFSAGIRIKKQAATRSRPAELTPPPHPNGDGGSAMPLPISEQRGLRRIVYERGFGALAHLEEAFGVGTNIQVVAKVRAS